MNPESVNNYKMCFKPFIKSWNYHFYFKFCTFENPFYENPFFIESILTLPSSWVLSKPTLTLSLTNKAQTGSKSILLQQISVLQKTKMAFHMFLSELPPSVVKIHQTVKINLIQMSNHWKWKTMLAVFLIKHLFIITCKISSAPKNQQQFLKC